MEKLLSIFICTLMMIGVLGSLLGNATKVNTNIDENRRMGCIFKVNQVKNQGNIFSSDIDFNVYYYITTKDHPDTVDNSSIDNIAILTLIGEKDINISDIDIFLTNDRKTYLETRIVEKGTWRIGEQITIQEIYPNEVTASCYNVRVVTPPVTADGKRRPVTERLVCIDNASIDTFNFFDSKNDDSQVGACDLPHYKDSKSYRSNSLGWIFCGEALGVEHKIGSPTWDPLCNVWEYTFFLVGTVSLAEDYRSWRVDGMDLYIEDTYNNFWGDTPGGIGSWNFDEGEEDHIGDYVFFACNLAVSCIGEIPGVSFILSAGQLADALRDAPDVSWTRKPGAYDADASGHLYHKIFIEPETTWEVKYNIESWYFDGFYLFSFSLDNDNGEGKIVFGETSPPEKNDPPLKPKKPSGSTELLVGKNYEFSVSTTDPEGHNIYYKWDWGDGTFSKWRGPYKSGETDYMWNAYNKNGHYDIRVKAKDIKGKESSWSDSLKVIVGHPPVFRWYSGPTTVKINEDNEFSWCGEDSDGDDIYYYIDWGDGSDTSWFGPYESGREVAKSHSWSSIGTYTFRLRAKDAIGLHSEWKTLEIEVIKKSKSNILLKMGTTPEFINPYLTPISFFQHLSFYHSEKYRQKIT